MHTATGSAYDVLVVGAGIIGLSVAWQLARRSRLRVAVLEKGIGVGEGSTGASSAVCRFRYSLDNTVLLARDGIAAYRDWASFTGLAAPRATFQNDGVLWLLGDDHSWAPAEAARMATFGVRAEVLDRRSAGVRSICSRRPRTTKVVPRNLLSAVRDPVRGVTGRSLS